jgi:hypothetical protein
MKHTPNMEDLMSKFITSVAQKNAVSMREKYLLRETMHSLVRLTKSEQLLEIRLSVKKLIPSSLHTQHIRRSRSRRNSHSRHSSQGHLAFGPQE